MRIVAIIQARMCSTRLPGKVLKTINGKSLLDYQIERLRYSNYIDEIVIATTDQVEDHAIEEFCEDKIINVFRGSKEDVLSRYFHAAKDFEADVVVRLTSDCPIIDPHIVDEVITRFSNSHYDYVSNTLERTFPRGMDTEVFSFRALELAYKNAKQAFEREHVTPYIYSKSSMFKLNNVSYPSDESSHRWTVDTEEDFLLVEKIVKQLYSKEKLFTLRDILYLVEKNPDWKKINDHIEQKKLGE